MRLLKTAAAIFFLSCGAFCQNDLPNAPTPTIDRHFVYVAGADAAMSFMDILTSSRATKNTTCYESNPVYGGANPTPQRFALQMGLQTVALNFLGYELKKHHKWYWFVPAMVDGEQHMIGSTLTLAHGCA